MLAEAVLAVAIGLIAYAVYKWESSIHDYFERRGIKSTKPFPILGDTGIRFFKKITAAEFANEIYHQFPNES